MSGPNAERDAGRVSRITDRDEYLAAVRDLEERASANPIGAPTTTLCCCHHPGEPCNYGFEDEHVHKCLPRGLDIGGHCPDSGCPGQCWTRPLPPGLPTDPEAAARIIRAENGGQR